MLLDTYSSNGTYINGHRLPPDEPRALRHGDEVCFGNLTMHVYFHAGKPAV